MSTSYTFSGTLLGITGAGATAITASIGTNLGDVALTETGTTTRLPERMPVTIAADGTFSVSLIASNSAGINISDGTLRYILYVTYRDAQGKRRDWNSGYFELVTNTNLADVAGTAVAVEVDEATAMVTTLVEQAVQDHTPGIELGYASRTSNSTSTATSAAAATALTGLSVTITGQGRPVDLRFYCPTVYHSIANTDVSIVIVRDGNVTGADNQIATVRSSSTSTGPFINATRRTGTLVAGTSYTFTVRAWGGAAGTCTLVGASFCPTELVVTSR